MYIFLLLSITKVTLLCLLLLRYEKLKFYSIHIVWVIYCLCLMIMIICNSSCAKTHKQAYIHKLLISLPQVQTNLSSNKLTKSILKGKTAKSANDCRSRPT